MTASARSLPSTRPSELVEWSRQTAGDLTLLRIGTQAQNVLGSCGDDHRINWGYAYAAAPTALRRSAIGAQRGSRRVVHENRRPSRGRSTRGCPARPATPSP